MKIFPATVEPIKCPSLIDFTEPPIPVHKYTHVFSNSLALISQI